MSSPAIAIQPHNTIIEAACLMLKYKVRAPGPQQGDLFYILQLPLRQKALGVRHACQQMCAQGQGARARPAAGRLVKCKGPGGLAPCNTQLLLNTKPADVLA